MRGIRRKIVLTEDVLALPGRDPCAMSLFPSGSPRVRTLVRRVAVVSVLANYAAQVPYYLHQYWFRGHVPPSWPGVALLAVTLAWFLLAYRRYVRGARFGRGLLMAFLATQVIFYAHALALSLLSGGHGGIAAQLTSPSQFLRVIFALGYLNALCAAALLVVMARGGPRADLPSASSGPSGSSRLSAVAGLARRRGPRDGQGGAARAARQEHRGALRRSSGARAAGVLPLRRGLDGLALPNGRHIPRT